MPADQRPEPSRRTVLDPQWEVALREGQEAEGEQGSVEDELAIVHLLRHARAPQALDDAALDRMWGDLDSALDEEPEAASGWRAWLRRPWLVLGTAGVATAAAAVLVMVWAGPSDDGQPSRTETIAQVDGEPSGEPGVDHGPLAETIEAQFALLEPGARAAVERSVDEGRAGLRSELVASALRADGRTQGGAP